MKVARSFRQVAGWLLVSALVYAPLALGSIPPLALIGLEALLALAALSWAADALLRRALPRLPMLVVVCSGWLLVQGWFMAWNAHSFYTWTTEAMTPILSPLPGAPGAADRMIAVQAMVRLTALVVGLWIAVDLAQESLWRLRLLWAMAWTGTLFALFGLIQQTGVVRFVAERMNPYEGIFFSTYNYHANAGAYLNLALPAIGVLLCVALAEKQARWRAVLLVGMFGCCLTAALVNTSRGAQAITALMLGGFVVWIGLRLARRGGPRARTARLALTLGLVVCLGLGGAVLPHLQRVVQKWERLPEVLSGDSGRMQVWPIAASMARQSGAFGQGPGAFKMLLPRSPLLTNAFYSRWIIQPPVPGMPTSMWSQAHEDYLQTLIEFGWVGGLAAGTLLFGGIFRAWAAVRWDQSRPTTFLYVGVLAALLAVALHATFDFPLQVASLQLYVAVYLGIAWATDQPDPSPASSPDDSLSLPPLS